MRAPIVLTLLVAAVSAGSNSAYGDTVDGRVTQVELPAQTITLYYVEAREVFTVRLKAHIASVDAQTMYIGDGKVAIKLTAHGTEGIMLQGDKLWQGYQFKNGDTIKVKDGYKQASELVPGDVYVTLPGVTFVVPEE